jgi:spore germination protein KC
MKKGIMPVLIILILTPLLGGCWNQRELTDLAIVMGMGIDKGTNGKKYDVTFQVVVPSNVTAFSGGGGGQGPPVVTYKTSGNTITEAARLAKRDIPRVLYFAHTNILLISEELAKEGILDILDSLDRDPEFRTTTNMIVVKNGQAGDLNSILTNLDKLPVNKFTKTLEATHERLGESFKISVDDVLSGIVSAGKEAMMSGFKLVGKAEKGTSTENINTTKPKAMIVSDGLAVFRKGKLAGWLTDEKARGALWVLKEMKGTYIDFDLKGKKDAVSVTPYLADTDVKVSVKNGEPFAAIKTETIFRLSEVNIATDLMDPQNTEVFEKKAAEKIKNEIESAIRQVQEYKADIFGFGESLHRSNPAYWKKVKKNWPQQFAEMDFEVKVNAFYRESGVRNNPFWKNMDK